MRGIVGFAWIACRPARALTVSTRNDYADDPQGINCSLIKKVAFLNQSPRCSERPTAVHFQSTPAKIPTFDSDVPRLKFCIVSKKEPQARLSPGELLPQLSFLTERQGNDETVRT